MFNLFSVFANEILIALWYLITKDRRDFLSTYKGKRKKERKQKQVLGVPLRLYYYSIVSASKMLTDVGKDTLRLNYIAIVKAPNISASKVSQFL